MRRIRIHAVAVALLATGCNRDNPTEPGKDQPAHAMPIETAANATTDTANLARVVATIETDNGGTTEFLDLGDGHIGIGERTPRNSRSAALPLVAHHDATPLEVYMALTPKDAGIPMPLMRDHQLRAQRSATLAETPRRLSAKGLTMSSLQTPGLEPYACDAFGFDWIDDWTEAFDGITTYRAALYRHQEIGMITFYPGAYVYYGTNTNSKTYLGACNGDAFDDLLMSVHRRISGVWVNLFQVSIGSYEKYTFYSGIPAFYRGRAQAPGRAIVEHYGVAAAWTISPGLAVAH